jgi:exodeoxyribonuclease VII small subunit
MINTTDIRGMNFESAIIELDEIAKRIKNGPGPVDNSVQDFRRCAALKAYCAARIIAAKAKIEQITLRNNGTFFGGPFLVDAKEQRSRCSVADFN